MIILHMEKLPWRCRVQAWWLLWRGWRPVRRCPAGDGLVWWDKPVHNGHLSF